VKLAHLSVASIIACVIGLLALAGFGLSSVERMRGKQAEMLEMLALRERIDDFSVAGDHFLLYRPDNSVWEAFRADALALSALLERMGEEHPAARRGARHIERIVEMVGSVTGHGEKQVPSGDGGAAPGPLEVPLRSRMIMTELAKHGIAMDTTLDQLLRERQAVIARQRSWIVAAFGAAALLFGAACILSFGLIYRRMGGTVRRLQETVARVAGGDSRARVPEHGEDELADLARAFNGMLERRVQAEERLQEYRALVEGTRDPCAIFDSAYRYVLVNRAYAEVYGCEPASIIGRHVSERSGEALFHQQVKPWIDRALAGEVCEFEAERVHVSRGRRLVLIRYYPLPGEDGRVERVGALYTDITEHRRAEAAIAEQGRLLEMAGRIGRFGGWAVDLESRQVEWSDVVAEIHGAEAGYAPALAEALEFLAPEDRERARRAFAECAEHGTAYDEELQILTLQGERRWVRSIAVPVRDAGGRITRVQGAFQDITARKESERRAETLAERLRMTLERINDGFFTLDRDWQFTYVNREAARLIECNAEDVYGRSVWEAFPAVIDTPIERAYRRAMDENIMVSLEAYYAPLAKWFDIRAHPSADGLAVFFRDVTERHALIERLRAREQELEASHERLTRVLETRQVLINSLPAYVALLDAEGRIVDVNEQWRAFGSDQAYPAPGAGVGRNYLQLCREAAAEGAAAAATAAEGLGRVLAGDAQVTTLEYACPAGETPRWFRMMANRLSPEGAGAAPAHGVVVMHVDVTERKLAEQELERIANEDPVSGALTRHGFIAAFQRAVAAADWQPDGMIVMLDIEGLHNINDAHGYDAGDAYLAQIAGRLRMQAGEGGLVGRAGGDQFMVYLPVGAERARAETRHPLATVFDQPFRVGELRIEAGARFGYTVLGDRRCEAETLVREAELALFETRHHVHRDWSRYNEDLDRAARERIVLARELRIALDEDQFELYFQPKVDLGTGGLIGCEALLRWTHPERGLQSPGWFIPLAEKSQLMAPIGDWALDEACRHLREWQEAGLPAGRVAVNVSVVQFRLGRFVERVREAIASHRIDPGELTLEITESVFERDSALLQDQLRQLHELGVRLSLDDFGTGYSSLLYLQRYPFDEIKVDQGFVQHILEDPYSRKIVTTVLGITGALGAEAVAEGIETPAVRDALLELGCQLGQGYYYSRPLPAAEFRALLAGGARLPVATDPGATDPGARWSL